KRADLETERVEVDEALRVALLVHGIRLERRAVLAVERLRGPAPGYRDVALVELEAHGAGDVTLALVHERLQRSSLRREPEAVVDHLGIPRDEGVTEVEHLTVEGERLQRAPRDVEDRAAGRLVHTARLHPDEPVLDEIHPPHAVLAAEAVQVRQERHRLELATIDSDGITVLELDLDPDRDIRRRFRRL